MALRLLGSMAQTATRGESRPLMARGDADDVVKEGQDEIQADLAVDGAGEIQE